MFAISQLGLQQSILPPVICYLHVGVPLTVKIRLIISGEGMDMCINKYYCIKSNAACY